MKRNSHKAVYLTDAEIQAYSMWWELDKDSVWEMYRQRWIDRYGSDMCTFKFRSVHDLMRLMCLLSKVQ